LELEMRMTRQRGPIGWAEGEARVGDALACAARLSFAFVDVDKAAG
jgi:3-hydroxymyristoyl/3-hydroxydecanoyl-(acyl carrier protein) dehydratase